MSKESNGIASYGDPQVSPEPVHMDGDANDENKERGNWSGKLDFILSCIGFAVGLGNVWRFPYLCYRNGGGAFLIPYACMLAVAGLPLFFMELGFGQFASLGPISIWRIAPAFRGIGYCMVAISGMVCIYYNIIIAYTLFFLFASFGKQVPWADCDNDWNTFNCTKTRNASLNNSDIDGFRMAFPNATDEEIMYFSPKSAAEEYWENFVLDISSGIGEAGKLRWQLALCLLLAWVIVFLCLVKGIKSTGKVVYFTATFPYVVLTILLVRGATLPGAIDGVKFYIIPDFKRLGDAKVWGDAAVQIFYSLGPAWGGLITMSSYNRFHNNCYRDALIVAITNCCTSVYAGFVIFSVIGFMAHELGVDVQDVTADGPGLAFVAYPEGLARMPVAPLWSVLFFFMLLTLGLDSMFVMLETVISAIYDEFPQYFKGRKMMLTLGISILFYLLGLPHVTQGGIYVMNLMDWYSAGFALMITALTELFVIMYFYGYSNYREDLRCMLGFYPNIYWMVTWNFLTPVVIIGIIVFNSINYTPVVYNGRPYPKWADGLGWLMVLFGLIWIPLFLLIDFVKYVKSWQRWKQIWAFPWYGKLMHTLCGPTPEWGPALPEHRRQRYGSAMELKSDIPVATVSGIDYAPPSYDNTQRQAYDNPSMDQSHKTNMYPVLEQSTPPAPPPEEYRHSYDNPAMQLEENKEHRNSSYL